MTEEKNSAIIETQGIRKSEMFPMGLDGINHIIGIALLLQNFRPF